MGNSDRIMAQAEVDPTPDAPAVPGVLVAFAWTFGAGDSILVNAYADHPDGRAAIDDARSSHENCANRDDSDVSGPTPIHTYVRTDASVDAIVAAAVKAERARGDALRAAIGALTDVLFAPKNESAALTKAMEMVAAAVAQDDGALRKMKGLDP